MTAAVIIGSLKIWSHIESTRGITCRNPGKQRLLMVIFQRFFYIHHFV